jgi:hypothetical protein
LFPDISFSPLFTIPVAPMVNGMTKHFILHISWISIITRFLHFKFFLASFFIVFLSDGIATSINEQILCLIFNYYIWPNEQNISVFTPWFHSTVTFSCSRTAFFFRGWNQ